MSTVPLRTSFPHFSSSSTPLTKSRPTHRSPTTRAPCFEVELVLCWSLCSYRRARCAFASSNLSSGGSGRLHAHKPNIVAVNGGDTRDWRLACAHRCPSQLDAHVCVRALVCLERALMRLRSVHFFCAHVRQNACRMRTRLFRMREWRHLAGKH